MRRRCPLMFEPGSTSVGWGKLGERGRGEAKGRGLGCLEFWDCPTPGTGSPQAEGARAQLCGHSHLCLWWCDRTVWPCRDLGRSFPSCPGLCQPVPACPSLSRPVPACPVLFCPVPPQSHPFPIPFPFPSHCCPHGSQQR